MMKNLDFLCMQAAQAMTAVTGDKNAKENLATKALGVLLENGPYGMILYLEVQKRDKDRDITRAYRDRLLALARDALVNPAPSADGDFQGVTEWLRKAAESLDTYLFIKRLWQQALMYARYQAKASE